MQVVDACGGYKGDTSYIHGGGGGVYIFICIFIWLVLFLSKQEDNVFNQIIQQI